MYLAESLARDHGAYVTMENPESSYMWAYLVPAQDLEFQDVVFTPCLFGADYLKPTRLRCWNWVPVSLTGMRCTRKQGVFTCGRVAHETLEFGGRPTCSAAEYVTDLCRCWAADVAALASSSLSHVQTLSEVRLTSDGPVSRHVSRGVDELSKKAVKDAEDREATAGCSNPAVLAEIWPELWDVMASVLTVLSETRGFSSDLRGLRGCCG